MNKFINTVFFALIITCTASHIFSSDAWLIPDEQVAQLMRANKQRENMMFMMAMLGRPEGWRLYKTRQAIARLSYQNGLCEEDLKSWMGPVGSQSIQDQIDELRIKALTAGLIENLNDLVALEDLEEVDPDNASTKRAFGVRS